MGERERGPLESELHDLIRRKSQGAPWLLDAQFEGRTNLSAVEIANQAIYGSLVLMEAILRLAREVDDLRAGR